MKHKKLMILAVLATLFGAPAGFRTANAGENPAPEVAADTSTLGLLAKGAGVDPDDVRWRVAAGLDVKQAVDAALSQKLAAEASAKSSKKGGK